MGTILFSKKVVLGRGDLLVHEPDAVGAVHYRAPIQFSEHDNKGTVGDAVERVEESFARYATYRREKYEASNAVIGHKLIRVRIWDPSIEWVEFEYAT